MNGIILVSFGLVVFLGSIIYVVKVLDPSTNNKENKSL